MGKTEGKKKKMVMLKHSKSATQPRSLSFCPNPFKIFIDQGFLNIILKNPFIIRLRKTFPTHQELPRPPSSFMIDNSVDCPLIVFGDDWRGSRWFASRELSRIVGGKWP